MASLIRLGLLGAGRNATGHAQAFSRLSDRCRLTAVLDPHRPAAEALAATCGARVCASQEELFAEVDAVVISSPNWLHPEQSIAAARAGLPIWCEKPMALTVADAEAMVAEAEAAGVRTFVGFSVRFSAVYQTINRRVRAGEVGPLVGAWSRRLSHWPLERLGWRADFAKTGGAIMELFVHELDWLVDLCGRPTSVYARKAGRQPEVVRDNDHLWVTLACPEGVTATLEGSVLSAMPDYYHGVTGREASLFTDKWQQKLFLQKPGEREPTELPLDPEFDKHAHFLDLVSGLAPSAADFAWGRDITRVAETAIDSALSGRALDPRRET